MGASVEQLERDIERTKAELANTLAKIEEKVSPRRLARDHRAALAAMGAGIVALMTIVVVRRAHSRR